MEIYAATCSSRFVVDTLKVFLFVLFLGCFLYTYVYAKCGTSAVSFNDGKVCDMSQWCCNSAKMELFLLDLGQSFILV